MSLEKLSFLLPRSLARKGLQEHAKASLFVFHAQKWIEEHLPELHESLHVRVVKDGVLEIACDHSIALQEMQMQKEVLLSALAEVSQASPTSISCTRS